MDYKIAKDGGDLPKHIVNVLGYDVDLLDSLLYSGFARAVESLAQTSSFHLFPTFWQVFLWGWGGFILTDRKDEEYAALSLETGVPIGEVDAALGAFDKLFWNASPWFTTPQGDSRRLLKLMPAALRGIGAFGRLKRYAKDEYWALGFDDDTERRMMCDHNVGKGLLDGRLEDLVK